MEEPKEELSKSEIAELQKVLEKTNPKIFSGVKGEKRKEIVEAFAITIESRFSGPIPPPDHLIKYDQIIPNGADRIMRMAEKQQSHRMELENKVVLGQLRQSGRGQIFGLIAVVLCIGATLYLAIKGYSNIPVALSSTVVLGLASIFVLGKRRHKKKLSEKDRG